MKGETQTGSRCGQGRGEKPRADHHVSSASFAGWHLRHNLLAPSHTYCRIHHLLLQASGLTTSEVETCVTSGCPGLGGEKRPSVWSQGHTDKEVPVNSDISRTFHSHPKLASWEPHSGLPENFYFRVFPNRLSRGPGTAGCLVGTTDSNPEDENSELGLTLASLPQKDCGVCEQPWSPVVCTTLMDRTKAGAWETPERTHPRQVPTTRLFRMQCLCDKLPLGIETVPNQGLRRSANTGNWHWAGGLGQQLLRGR